jgi:hypothetical protein
MLGFITNLISPTKNIIGFEDVVFSIKNHSAILINTLSIIEQTCLICTTIPYDKEDIIMNQMIENNQLNNRILLYGKNTTDESVDKKYKQLLSLGFTQVYIYTGGMFEWLLLQDIYGTTEFPTTMKCKDLLLYRPLRMFSHLPQITL